MRICLLCTNDPVEKRIRLHFEDKLELHKFNKSERDLSAFDAVLIVEPYVIKGQYLSICTIWKNYLARHYPEMKLLIAGFDSRVRHTNYLPLLSLHNDHDFESFMNDALPVKKVIELKGLQNGYGRVIDRLKLFFKGHNHESIIDSISKVRQVLNNAELSLYGSKKLKREKEPFKKVWEKKLWAKRKFFQHFYSRWDYYKDYFEHLPFYYQLEEAEVMDFIDGLSGIFSQKKQLTDNELKELEKKYQVLDPFNQIGEITSVFRQISTKYINPENVGTILLIDDDEIFHQQLKSSMHNFSFQSMYNPVELESLTKQDEYDLIILDLDFKEDKGRLTGLDWIGRLKEMYPDTPLCIATVHNEHETIQHAIEEEGADFFLSKSLFDAEKWTTIFFNLQAPKKYSLGEIILFNQSKEWEDSPNILVVEDEESWFHRLSDLSEEYRFFHANTIQQAKDWLRSQNFDLVLLDLYFRIDGKDELLGLQLISYIKQKYTNLPLIVTSKDSSNEIRQKMSELGVDKFLFKEEFDPEKWLEILQTAVEFKRHRDKFKSL